MLHIHLVPEKTLFEIISIFAGFKSPEEAFKIIFPLFFSDFMTTRQRPRQALRSGLKFYQVFSFGVHNSFIIQKFHSDVT